MMTESVNTMILPDSDDVGAVVVCADLGLHGICCRGKMLAGAPVGGEGKLCSAHYRRRHNRARQARRVARGVLPCGICGDTVGFMRPGDKIPTRYRMTVGGGAVRACHACRYPPGPTLRRKPAPEPVLAAPGPTLVVTYDAPAPPPPEPRSPSPAAIRRAALAIHSELAAAGDRIEDERIRAIDRDSDWEARAAEDEAAKRRDAARAAIKEGLASARARKVWAPALAAKVAAFEPDLDRVPAPAKKKGPGPGLRWKKKKFTEPTTRLEQGGAE